MNELRSFLNGQLRRYLVCGALGCLVSLPVAAQSLQMPTRLDRFHVFSNGNLVSNQYASGFEAEGIRLSQNARVYGAPTTGGVSLSKQLAINTRNGIVVAEARQKISARQIAKGIGAVAGGPLGLALLGTAVIADLLDDADVEYQNGQWRQISPDSCTNPAGCAGYRWDTSGWGSVGPTTNPSGSAACPGFVGRSRVLNGHTLTITAASSPTNVDCNLTYVSTQGPCCGGFAPAGRTSATVPYGIVTNPITAQQAEDRLTAANPSPAVLRDLAEVGDYVPTPEPTDPAQVTNPQPSQEKTTTKTNPDGSTETTVCRTTGSVSGNSVRLQEACTVTARDPQGNITGTTTTTTDDADPKPSEEEPGLLCELFPNIVACAELGEADEDIPTETRNVDYQAETLFGGGSCPVDQTIQFYGTTLPITNYAYACDMLATYVRPIALLLAAFTALMIIARGMPE